MREADFYTVRRYASRVLASLPAEGRLTRPRTGLRRYGVAAAHQASTLTGRVRIPLAPPLHFLSPYSFDKPAARRSRLGSRGELPRCNSGWATRFRCSDGERPNRGDRPRFDSGRNRQRPKASALTSKKGGADPQVFYDYFYYLDWGCLSADPGGPAPPGKRRRQRHTIPVSCARHHLNWYTAGFT